MLDILQSVSLLGLIITHYFLVRGCFSIKEELPIQGGIITGRLDRTADLLDEVAQLISDLTDSQPSQAPLAPSGGGFADLLGAFLNNRMNMASEHATTQQQWEIHEEEINPATTQEYQPHDDSATVSHR
jgi:hypothetical protein